MAITAPLSSYQKSNFKIFLVVIVAVAVWFGYDGYFNKKFIKDHTKNQGSATPVPDTTLVANRAAPLVLAGIGAVLVVNYLLKKDRRVVAEEDRLIVNNTIINYSSIKKVDKTYFDTKGFFVIEYTDTAGNDKTVRLSDRTYDNLQAVLETVIKKIT